MREAFPYDSAPKYLIFDRGAHFNDDVDEVTKSFGIEHKRASFQSPWQNGIAERWVGSCRRELLDQIIVVNERHLKSASVTITTTVHILALASKLRQGEWLQSKRTWAAITSMLRIGGLNHRNELDA